MLKTRVIPSLLLRNKGLVKTVQFKNATYVGCPINAIKIFNDKEVDELIFLDITATPENRDPPFSLIAEIASECFMPFGYGGGIRSLDDIRKLFRLGAEKVIINTYAAENPTFVKQASDLYGSQSIVVSLDVEKNFLGKHIVFTHGGMCNTNLEAVKYAVQMQEMGAGELFLNSIDRDGTMKGYDIGLVKRVSSAVDIPVIACGGAGKLQHFADAVKLGGASAVSAGSFFVFHGRYRAVLITYPSIHELEAVL